MTWASHSAFRRHGKAESSRSYRRNRTNSRYGNCSPWGKQLCEETGGNWHTRYRPQVWPREGIRRDDSCCCALGPCQEGMSSAGPTAWQRPLNSGAATAIWILLTKLWTCNEEVLAGRASSIGLFPCMSPIPP